MQLDAVLVFLLVGVPVIQSPDRTHQDLVGCLLGDLVQVVLSCLVSLAVFCFAHQAFAELLLITCSAFSVSSFCLTSTGPSAIILL